MVRLRTPEKAIEATVAVVFPYGFGYGEGMISVKKQLADPSTGLTAEALQVGIDIIQYDHRVFDAVDADALDDGCGDGRTTAAVYRIVPVMPESPEAKKQRQEFAKSRLRAKVFGGGLSVFSSMRRTAVLSQQTAITAGDTLKNDRLASAEILAAHGVEHGGHTCNEHANSSSCGCGALDKYEEITQNAITYGPHIRQTLQTVLGPQYEAYQPAIEAVMHTYRDILQHKEQFFINSSGKESIDLLENTGAVIKDLSGEHLEDFVVINDVEGTTFDQRMFDAVLRERGVRGEAQAFSVDLWRGRMYAELTAQHAQEEFGMDYDQTYRIAMADFLIRTLATSATLTAGDQPVVLRSAA